ncbi:DUF3168 domain-containing protein [Loktanella salsilacus]|uniref:DUF3168 domain-containing protein n=1 Tax=Loktanella salsilacus TaxID=195913 RepID=UPI003703F665
MSTPSEALQQAILNILLADAAVAEVVGDRIHDGRPTAYPSITFGPADSVPEDMDCINGLTETLQIDCWVRDGDRLRPAKALTDKVRKAVHRNTPDLDTHALVNLQIVGTRAFMDPDGKTGHGIVTIEAEIEER